MSSQKWKELANRKTELGKKINFIHDTILRNDLGEKISHESFQKMFKPITDKLDDVVIGNMKVPVRRKLRLGKKGDIISDIDYAPEVDPYEEIDVEGLVDLGGNVRPEQEKQIPLPPPPYPLPPPPYKEPEGPDYGTLTEVEDTDEDTEVEDTDEDTEVEDTDKDNITAQDFGLPSYDEVQIEFAQKKKKGGKTKYLRSVIGASIHERNRLDGFDTSN